MDEIRGLNLVIHANPDSFVRLLREEIERGQAENLRAEIQFSRSQHANYALVIWR